MNPLVKIFLPVFIVSQSLAQNINLQSKKWILMNSRIEKNDIQLATYSPSKLKADSFVMQFMADGKVDYDYETNASARQSGRTEFLDIDTRMSSWEYDAALNVLVLTLKGGYASLDDFNFKRSYKIEPTKGGYLLRQLPEQYASNLKNSPPVQPEASKLLAKETSEKTSEIIGQPVAAETHALVKETLVEEVKTRVVDYRAQSKAMLISSKRWILLGNKINKNIIRLTSFDVSKFRINTLVLNFGADGKIEYDYESDPEIEFCAGIEFLDIDTDKSTWFYDEGNNILTLTIKGGYASLDDFKFKRDYRIEQIGDEYVLHKVKEHYFIDLKKQNRKSGK